MNPSSNSENRDSWGPRLCAPGFQWLCDSACDLRPVYFCYFLSVLISYTKCTSNCPEHAANWTFQFYLSWRSCWWSWVNHASRIAVTEVFLCSLIFAVIDFFSSYGCSCFSFAVSLAFWMQHSYFSTKAASFCHHVLLWLMILFVIAIRNASSWIISYDSYWLHFWIFDHWGRRAISNRQPHSDSCCFFFLGVASWWPFVAFDNYRAFRLASFHAYFACFYIGLPSDSSVCCLWRAFCSLHLCYVIGLRAESRAGWAEFSNLDFYSIVLISAYEMLRFIASAAARICDCVLIGSSLRLVRNSLATASSYSSALCSFGTSAACCFVIYWLLILLTCSFLMIWICFSLRIQRIFCYFSIGLTAVIGPPFAALGCV